MRAQFRLWDVFAQQQMIGQVYTTIGSNWRRISHIVADAIYKRVTGEEGYFDSRIVYIAETVSLMRRIKRVAIMDQDGENHHFLTDGSSLVLTPRFSPSRQEITYMSYHGKVPRVYIFNIDTGRQEVLGDFPGMTFAPRFSPDGNTVIMSMAKDGNTEIYVMDLRTRQAKRQALDNRPAAEWEKRLLAAHAPAAAAGQDDRLAPPLRGAHRPAPPIQKAGRVAPSGTGPPSGGRTTIALA